MGEVIRILWLRDRYPLMQFEVQCPDDKATWRLLARLPGILRALLKANKQGKEE